MVTRPTPRTQTLNKKNSQNGNSANRSSVNGAGSYSTTISREQFIHAYRTMLRARIVDEKIIVLYKQNKCHFQIGVAGHEAVQVATAQVFRPKKDWFYPYYRDMALCAGLGMTDEEFLLNSMNKRDDPNSHGLQMPMHYGHKDLNIVNQSSPTGTQFLQAVGAALALRKRKEDAIVYVSSGEGSCAQGDFHEAINWASRDKLGVVFVIQNNKYAISVPVEEQITGKSLYKLVAGYENLERHEVDGTDYIASYEVMLLAHKRALNGDGPVLVEAHVPRLQSHSISDNHLKYRTQKDIEDERKRCPIGILERYLVDHKLASIDELKMIQNEVKKSVDNSAEWAERQPDCDPTAALDNNFVNPNPANDITEGTPQGDEIYMVDALNHALDEEMSRNKDIYIFGQDVAGGKGGVFTVTAGLTAKHGAERCFNSQLAESSIAGVAIGMATLGLKPVAEIQFGDYIWTAMMQIRNELAMLHYRSGGDFSCPAVIRVPVGGYIHGGTYHSQNIEATFAHFPGLYIIYPSNATDAKGLLKTAIRSEDPVLFLEHKGLYRQVYAKGPEGGIDFLTPIGKAKVVRKGNAATIITWGALVQKSLLAARELSNDGVEVEVIDLRTIVPFDKETVFESVKKTGRALIAHEDIRFMGFGAEIAAQISEECFNWLDAPIRRVAAKDVAAIAHSGVIEDVVLPQNHDVLRALEELISF